MSEDAASEAEPEADGAVTAAAEPEPTEPEPTEPEADAPPTSPELQQAERAFAVGDFRIVRELLPALGKDDDPAIRAAADTLARRVAVDPVHVGVLTLSAVLLVVLVYSYFG